ncbi:spore gernimation protein GerC [Thermaerobacter sp. FW80]|uniref:Ger(x)C family spore germination protein n=1 Tax=Thermaerobacter sp. FW80 TaxID=2546351 RepID=UPI00107559FB|nr:Ger(x)C family spore germination C-terminal domain-containing protein [Thermaerobacter sp. FW80]QBS36646.1 spore gernimation protein GerC [Thermaerobacter sp. FW80]
MRARLGAGFVLVLSALALTGCWGYSEVNDLAFVTVAALDRAPSGGYRWTVAVPVPELVLPASLGGAGAGAAGAATRTNLFRSAVGPGPQAAAQALDDRIPREVRWSFADHILVGEAAARSGLRPLLEMISRGYRVERRASLYVVRGEAGAMLLQLRPSLDRAVARSFDAVTRKNRPGTIRGVDGNTVLRWLDTPGTDPFLPVVTTAGEGSSGSPAPAGIALFRGDRLVGFLPPPLHHGLLMARGEAHPFTLVVPCPGETATAPGGGGSGDRTGGTGVSLQVDHDEARVRVIGPTAVADGAGGAGASGADGAAGAAAAGSRANGAKALSGAAMPGVRLEVDLAGVVLEWQCRDPQVDRRRIQAVAQAAARQTRGWIEAALARAAALGVDPVGFGAALHRQDPATWRTIRTQWRTWVRDLRPELTVTFHVRGQQLTVSAP